MQRRIQGPSLDLQQVRGTVPDRLADTMAMLRAPSQNPQYQHVERALQQLDVIFLKVPLSHGCLEGILVEEFSFVYSIFC